MSPYETRVSSQDQVRGRVKLNLRSPDAQSSGGPMEQRRGSQVTGSVPYLPGWELAPRLLFIEQAQGVCKHPMFGRVSGLHPSRGHRTCSSLQDQDAQAMGLSPSAVILSTSPITQMNGSSDLGRKRPTGALGAPF